MTNWLRKHWVKIFIGFGILIFLFFLYGGILGLIARHDFNKKIKEKDIEIGELKQDIQASEKREERLIESGQKSHELALEQEAKIRKKDAEMRVKLAEKRALKKKIREMPITQVIVRTIEIINCPDIVQQTQGIVFTLDCAKDNLAVLENVFYFKKEALDWADQFFTSQAEVVNLKDAIKEFAGAYKERGKQLGKKDGMIAKWEGKFNLSEKRGKRSWWKGFKKGATIVGIAGGIIIFVLRK